MSVPFSRTTRALQADRFRRPGLALAGSVVLLAAWGCWLVAARVDVYAVAGQARLEAGYAAHAVEAPASGRVVSVRVALGQAVAPGDVLFELDAEAERLRLEEALAHRSALVAQVEALRQQRSAGGRALGEAQAAGAASLDEAAARYDEAESAARLAEAEAARLKPLYDRRFVAEAEYQRVAGEARQKRAAAEALRQGVRRLELQRQQEGSDRSAGLDALAVERARLEGEIAATTALIARLEHEIARRRVTAPVQGHVGELAELRAGAFVEAGDRLGAVVPAGVLRAVAWFEPSVAAGRIAPGQPARLRLDGFPWTRFGTVRAAVARVSSEVQEGRLRVEFDLTPDPASQIPLQHGLPGTVEVQVERATPLALVVRQTGKLLRSR